MLRKIRTLLAAVFLVGITLLFLDFTGTIHAYLGWMAKVQLLPAILALHAAIVVGLIILTLVFGRVYCSVICPLGVLQDLIARIGRHGKKLPYRYSPALNRLRYPLLLLMVVALVAGIGSVVTMLAPYTTFGRIASQLLQPVYLLANNGLAWTATCFIGQTLSTVDCMRCWRLWLPHSSSVCWPGAKDESTATQYAL